PGWFIYPLPIVRRTSGRYGELATITLSCRWCEPDRDRVGVRASCGGRQWRRFSFASACSGGAGAPMIPLPSGVRVWLATGHTDMRKGFASLSLLVQEGLRRDPLCGHLFAFVGAAAIC